MVEVICLIIIVLIIFISDIFVGIRTYGSWTKYDSSTSLGHILLRRLMGKHNEPETKQDSVSNHFKYDFLKKENFREKSDD